MFCSNGDVRNAFAAVSLLLGRMAHCLGTILDLVPSPLADPFRHLLVELLLLDGGAGVSTALPMFPAFGL